MRIFLAGAAGAIGRRLVPLLVAAGHEVTGTTRSPEKAATLKAEGVEPVIVDVFDANALHAAVTAARPEAVIHQLTDLSAKDMEEARERNTRIRIEATPYLMAAAKASGARRVIAQSIAFAYATGPEPLDESAPLNLAGEGSARRSAEGVVALEQAVLGMPDVEGIVLRYGRLYGPGTWFATPNGKAPLHVDAAAHAALLALTHGRPGIYNVAEDDRTVTIDKARRELGFDPAFRIAG